MNNELEKQIIDSLDNVEIESKIPNYQVWVFELDKNKDVLDEELIYDSTDPELAVNFAKNYVDEFDKSLKENTIKLLDTTRYCEVQVETVIELDNEEENIGTIFYNILEVARQ